MFNLDALLPGRPIAEEMVKIYNAIYKDEGNTLYYIKSHRPEYADIRHCIRALLAEKHKVGPSVLARAETLAIRMVSKESTQPVNHATIINSLNVVQNTLTVTRPRFVFEMRKIVFNNYNLTK